MGRSVGVTGAAAGANAFNGGHTPPYGNEKKHPPRRTVTGWCGNCAEGRFRMPPKRRTLQMMLVAGVVLLVGIALSTVTFLLLLPDYSSGEQANFHLECVTLANNLDKVLSSQQNLKVKKRTWHLCLVAAMGQTHIVILCCIPGVSCVCASQFAFSFRIPTRF